MNLIEVTFNATGKKRKYNVVVLLGAQGRQIMSANPFYVSHVPDSIDDDMYRNLAIRYNLPERLKHEPETGDTKGLADNATETPDATTVLTEKPKRGRKPKA